MILKELLTVIPSLNTITVICPDVPDDWVYKGTREGFQEAADMKQWMEHEIAFVEARHGAWDIAIW